MFRKRMIAIVTVVLFTLSVSGCGTILHPERKGQAAGQIDPKIAILNGLGLVLFLVPGVIAFAVDFNNGAIYLPGGSSSSIDYEQNDSLVIIDSDRGIDKSYIEQIVSERTGGNLNLEAASVEAQIVSSSESLKDLVRYF